MLTISLVFLVAPSDIRLRSEVIEADLPEARTFVYESNPGDWVVMQENTLKPTSPSYYKGEPEEITVIVTGYSSTPEQTDDTPFVTASGTRVEDGVVATNLLPFGTEIKIPELYGDRVFVVEDRMHPRNSVHVDIWFPSYWEAKSFGAVTTNIEVLN